STEREPCNQPEASEEHVGRPNGLGIDAVSIRDSLEHDALVHADPHLPKDVPQKNVALLFGCTAEEGFQEATAGPRRVGATGLRDLRKHAGGLQDGEWRQEQGGLLRSADGTLQERASDGSIG